MASFDSDTIPLTEYGTQPKNSRAARANRKLNYLLILSGVFIGLAALTLVFAIAAYNKADPADCAAPVAANLKGALPQGAHLVGSARDALPSHVKSQLDLGIPGLPKAQVLAADSPKKPNIFVFLADDLGYGDLSVYGHPTQPWGPLDEMASKGVRFSQLYADSFCTPSRAQFLTGRLAVRSGMQGQNPRVLLTGNPGGLPAEEVTIAEMLKEAGYVTGMNGKWHMGINCETNTDGCHLPFNHGFDDVGTYFPVSNNLVCDETKRYSAYPSPQICFLYQGKGTTPWQAPAYHENITELYLKEIKDFITKNREGPWFYTFNSPQTHDVMYSSARFRGSTPRGDFGDALAEMSYAAGEIVRHLVSLDLAKDTLFLFYADNGAPTTDCLQAGNNGHMRAGKGTGWEGGIRVPGFAYWPGMIQPGVVSDALLTSADFFPTFAKMGGGVIPTDRIIDGVDMSSWLFGDLAQPVNDRNRPLFFYCGQSVIAVRYMGYKVHYRTYNDPADMMDCVNGQPKFVQNPLARVLARQDCNDSKLAVWHDPPLLFNLNEDPSERFPLEADYHIDLLKEVADIVAQQEATRVPAPDQLQGFKLRLIPCCNEATNCVCNYPFPENLDIPKFAIPKFGDPGLW